MENLGKKTKCHGMMISSWTVIFFFLEGGDALYSATMNLITLIPSYCFTAQIIREKMKVCCENIEGGEKMWTRNSKENRFLKKSKNFEMVFRGKKKCT